MTEPIFDHERLDVYRLSIDYVAFSYRIARSLSGVNRPARDQLQTKPQRQKSVLRDCSRVGAAVCVDS